VEIIMVNKIKGSLSNDVGIARVVYKATAGISGVSDTKVVIDSGVDRLEKQIQNLSATKSTVHTVYMKVANPNSVSILVAQ
jgi:LEA14-like dessication related protein